MMASRNRAGGVFKGKGCPLPGFYVFRAANGALTAFAVMVRRCPAPRFNDED